MNVNGMEWNEKSGETVAEERQKKNACMDTAVCRGRKTGNALGLIIGKFLTAIVIDLLFTVIRCTSLLD